jgi:hypothetical protein
MYWFPKTIIGKVAFWLGVSAFVLMYLQYWFAMIFKTSVMFPGALVVVFMIAAGVIAVIALTKYKDRGILLYLPAVIGCLGLLLVLGELLFPH